MRVVSEIAFEEAGATADTFVRVTQPGNPHRPRAGARLVAAPLLLCALATALAIGVRPATTDAAVPRPGAGELSPRLAELARPALRSAPEARQARALRLPVTGPGSLLRDGNRVLVEVRFEHGAAAGAADLRAAGAETVEVSPRYQTVTVAAKPGELRALSAVPRVAGATEVLAPLAAASSTCPSGAAVSEGDQQLKAADARTAFGVDGGGVTVGILSDSFDLANAAADGSGPIATHAPDDVESGDLPGPANTCPGEAAAVDVLADDYAPGVGEPEPADEGRAMAQIVHDLAPGAALSFATAFTGLTAFAGNIEALAAAGADVVTDDVSYFEEPFFQEGPVGVAARKVSEGGATYLSSAGNNNLVNGGRDIASWEAPAYRDSNGCPTPIVELSALFEGEGAFGLNPTHCMDFDPGAGTDTTFRITVSKGATLLVDLQWAEPWNGVTGDIDAFLLGPKGTVVGGSIEDNIFGSQRPFELVAWENKTGVAAEVQLVVNRYSGSFNPALKLALLQNGGGVSSTEYESSAGGDVVGPTIFGHNGARDAISVGAIHHNATTAPEAYSSRGPVTHRFGPVEGAAPAAALPSPETLAKPDLVATDCGVTTFFAFDSGSGWRFCGTSAAAPHAAAVAALMREAAPAATPAEIGAALTASAQPVGSFGPDAVGSGVVDAMGALGEITETPPPEEEPEEEEGGGGGEEEGEEESEEGKESGGSGEEGSSEEAAGEPQQGEAEAEGESGQSATSTAGAAPASASPQSQTAPDVSAPDTTIRRHPPRLRRTRRRTARVVFRFGSTEAAVVFLCKFDRRRFHRCGRRTVRRLKRGRHVLRVQARDAAGNTDRTPAVFRFRVKRVR